MQFSRMALILSAAIVACAVAAAQETPVYTLDRIGDELPGSTAHDIDDQGHVLVHVENVMANYRGQALVTSKDSSAMILESAYNEGPFFLELLEDSKGFIAAQNYNGIGKIIFNEKGEHSTAAEFCPSTQNYKPGDYLMYLSSNAEHAYYKTVDENDDTIFVSCASGELITPVKADEHLSRFMVDSVSNDGTLYLHKSIDGTVMWAYPQWPDGTVGYKDGYLFATSPNANCLIYQIKQGQSPRKTVRECEGKVVDLPTLPEEVSGDSHLSFSRINDRGDVVGSMTMIVKDIQLLGDQAPAALKVLASQAIENGEDEYRSITARVVYTFDNQLIFLPILSSDQAYKDNYSITAINARGDLSGVVEIGGETDQAIAYRRAD